METNSTNMNTLKISIKNLNNKKETEKATREINKIHKLYKDIDIFLDFENDSLKTHELEKFFWKLECTHDWFRNHIKIGYGQQEEIFSIAYQVFDDKLERFKKKTTISILAVSLILIIGVLFYAYGGNLYKASIQPIVQKHRIKNKINYLIKEYELESGLSYHYKEHGEKFNRTKNLNELSEAVYNAVWTYNLSENIIIAMIRAESDFSKYAISSCGAVGYGQIMLTIWGSLVTNENKIFEPEENVHWSGWILKLYIEQNKGDIYKAIFNYNGGRWVSISKTQVVATQESFEHLKKMFNTIDKLGYYDSHF